MIIVQLIGGLGNQLFQYATGRRLAYMRQVPLKLDITGFETYKVHAYSLGQFNIIENFARPDEISRYKKQGLIHRARRRLLPYSMQRHVLEKQYSFQPAILNLPGDVYLQGYWQSERYFKDIEDVLRREITVKTSPNARNAAVAQQIASVEAVSLHVRRGDYVTNPDAQKVLGLAPVEYYQTAVEQIEARVKDPHLFIFSDDPDWARDNLHFDRPTTVVDHNNADRNYEDLRLMSLCKYHIIANSSFSWWGAWLASFPEKIVFCPAKWGNLASLNTPDRIPDEWERI